MRRTYLVGALFLGMISSGLAANTQLFTLSKSVNPTSSGQVLATPQPLDSSGSYSSGTVVTIFASANAGYSFVNWSGSVSGSDTSRTLVMNENKSVTANFNGSPSPLRFTLSKIVNPTGSGELTVSPLPGTDGKYSSGTLVSVTAHAAPGFVFSSWSGAATGSANPVQLLMNENRTITGNFGASETPRFSLTTSTVPINAGNIYLSPTPSSVDGKYTSGTIVTVYNGPKTGYLFNNWSGDLSGSENPTHILVDGDKNVVANFVEQPPPPRFTLTRVVNPPGAGEISLSPIYSTVDGKYSSGTLVTVTANPATGYAFGSWSGAATGTDNPTHVLMNENKTITANFVVSEVQHFSITTSTLPLNAGNVYLSPLPGQDGKYTSGTIVTVYNGPKDGYTFLNWSGDLTGSENPTHILVNGNKAITANFVQAPPRFTLTKIVNPTGAGEIHVTPAPATSDGKYTSGTVVTLTAVAATGNTFNGWNGAATGSANPVQIVMLENKTATANFITSQPPTRFTLTKLVNPTGSGEVSASPLPDNDGKYTSGTVVTLTAHPATGHTFFYWTGAAAGTENPTHVLMNENKTVTGNFSGEITARFTLTHSVTPQGAGEIGVSPLPGTDGKYSSGTVVSCSAHAFAGYVFAHWEGAAESTTIPLQIKMTENKAITAVFEAVSSPSSDLGIRITPLHNPTIVNAPLILGIEIDNHGPSAAAGVRFEYHVPTNATFTTCTVSQGTVGLASAGLLVGELGNLGVFSHASAAVIITPVTTSTLQNYASVSGAQPDPYVTNNAAHIEVRVVSEILPAPDLIGLSGDVTRTTLSNGSRIDGTFIFTNDGELPSKKCRVQYFLSGDDTLDSQDVLVRSQSVGGLQAGSSTSKHVRIRVRANAQGQHVICVLDPAGSVNENDEVNNVVISPPVP